MELSKGDQDLLARLQGSAFQYFLDEANPRNGLVRDAAHPKSDASIAAVGMALACYPVAIERGYVPRAQAVHRVLATLRFLWRAPQNAGPTASGYRGLFYHFLDMERGARARRSELSTIDSAILFAGALTVSRYFRGPGPEESEIRWLADELYRRADWAWITDEHHRLALGWTPERGFLPYHWGGYNEALILLVLALGSPTHPTSPEAYRKWLETYRWKKIYGHEFVYSGPLFTHQLSHAWIDFRGIRDDFMRVRDIDYFENSRRATLIQREYARRNPGGFLGYDKGCWGISASAGPGPALRTFAGRERRFWGYRARGVPWGPDDGTLSPWAAAASLPFAPSEVMEALRAGAATASGLPGLGVTQSFNPTFAAGQTQEAGWVAEASFGVDQGPLVLMIENERSELVWTLMKKCPYVIAGLVGAGFEGGWL